jgi:hypothetical protein
MSFGILLAILAGTAGVFGLAMAPAGDSWSCAGATNPPGDSASILTFSAAGTGAEAAYFPPLSALDSVGADTDFRASELSSTAGGRLPETHHSITTQMLTSL